MSMLLSLFKRVFLSRAGSVMLGVFAAVMLIWFAGPYIGLKAVNMRLVVIGVLLGIVFLYLLISWLITRSRAKKFSDELSKQGASDGRKADIQELKKKMDAAVAQLKTSDLGIKHRGTAAMYALPWFMIIGPSAAGKSTLLRNSGLHFPYQHKDDIDIKGFGGTRNCDWWFSDQAVILDTAGRYTTEESDKDEWFEFLSLVKKYRRKMPINGIIVAVSLSDLLTADADKLDWHVNVVRDRINELTTQLGYVFPLYIVFTKCDLLNGFQAYFADLNEAGRNQVWGAHLDCKPGEQPGDQVAVKFDELYAKLCELRMRKLHTQRKIQIKSFVYDFPVQFKAASDRLLEFINLLFKDNPYQETPNFKGVYFTSGTQEGMPLQRIVGNLRQAFGQVDAKDGVVTSKTTRSYFINSLLKQVIFKSSLDVSMSRKKQILTRWVKTLSIVGAFVVILAGLGMYSTAFTSNSLLANESQSVVDNMVKVSENDRATPADRYLALTRVYKQYNKLKAYRTDRPWYFDIGIYHGEEQITPLEKVIIRSLEQEFLRPVAELLELKLRDYALRWQATTDEAEHGKIHTDYYDAFKVYLMLGTIRRLNDKEALPLLQAAWRAILKPENKVASKLLNKEIDTYLPELTSLYLNNMRLASNDVLAAAAWKLDKNSIYTARAQLRTPPNASILYSQVVKKSMASLQPITIRAALKSRGTTYFDSKYRLPGIYSRKGWEDYASREFMIAVSSASQGDWVLGTEQAPAVANTRTKKEKSQDKINHALALQLEKQIRARYFADYVRYWYEFLGSVKIQRDRSIADSAHKLSLLSQVDGPIAELFALADKNINLVEIKWHEQEEGSRDYVKTVVKKMPAKNTLFSSSTSAKNSSDKKSENKLAPVPVKVAELEIPFRDLRRYTSPGEKMFVSELLNRYLVSLASLQGELEQLRSTSEQGREAELIAANVLSGQGNSTAVYKAWSTTTGIINGSESRTRRVIQPIFMTPIKDAWRVTLGSALAEIQAKWRTLVLQEYKDRIRGRFPFVSQGPDATLDDVAEFFRPEDGILWSFVDTHLAAYLVKRHGTWRERHWMGLGPGFNNRFIAMLKRSDRITKGLFRRGSDQPDVTFYLYPMPTSGISEILLESNGQVYRYRNEPQEWRKFKWPGMVDNSGARVSAVSDKNNVRAEISTQGMWGLFHLFRKADVKKERGTQYLSSWNMDGANGKKIRISFRVKADRQNNLLSSATFGNYNLPKYIIGRNKKKVAKR